MLQVADAGFTICQKLVEKLALLGPTDSGMPVLRPCLSALWARWLSSSSRVTPLVRRVLWLFSAAWCNPLHLNLLVKFELP